MHKDTCTGSPEYWIARWNEINGSSSSFGGYGSAATWNAMATEYGRHSGSADKENRISETLSFLENRGVPLANARILDIGSGPGFFAKAFAAQGADVVCVDISTIMIERLQREIAPRERERITPVLADWKTLDLASAGFIKAFDLVFANMTPAISGPEAFLKIMRASRRWCWFKGWAGPRHNPLLERLHQAVSGSAPDGFKGNFLCAWNLACASGYFPDCFFQEMQWTERTTLAACTAFHTTLLGAHTGLPARELAPKIDSCLRLMAVDGYIEHAVRGRTGAMLWKIDEPGGVPT
ncbi:MAG: class I SAM-dependent methyltransferase [Chitinispirillaceae bacterium]|nr:class I SAM-dependent methyltransferase [Chitinispirillaceae bacterium]